MLVFLFFSMLICSSDAGISAFLTKSQTESTCSKFGAWKAWTDECLFFPLHDIRKKMVQACEVAYNFTTAMAFPLPPNFQQPQSPCGYCSFKFRCQTRRESEGCGSVNGEKQICREHSQICALPVSDAYGCQWNVHAAALKACLNRADVPDWRRTAYKRVLDFMPQSNCVKVNNQCKCCCHPFTPNTDGTSCVEQTTVAEDKCPAFSPFSDWSSCLWAPSGNLIGEFARTCGLNLAKDLPSGLVTGAAASPTGFQLPEKCGFCSFRTRCRKRTPKSGCFAIDAEKKPCSSQDCATCGDVCTLPKLNGTSCAWGRLVAGKFHARLQAFDSPLVPYYKRQGVQALLHHIPYTHCKQMGDVCKCCCHPYVPNGAGTACVVADMCSTTKAHH